MFMNNLALFSDVAVQCSAIATQQYSTSFASAIRLLHKDLQGPIHAIYGLVRFADEIVDTFHDYNKKELLARFKSDTFSAIEEGISLNPILHSFQETVRRYKIDLSLIEAFFKSMETDLEKQHYSNGEELSEYIYGSAEVVGLMCLAIFCEGDRKSCEALKPAARALGSAFQKVNFLRDLKADYHELNRIYFPGLNMSQFNEKAKRQIEQEIQSDLNIAYKGIKQLPMKARFGVYVAYRYYNSLFKKIKSMSPGHIMNSRVRISNPVKLLIICRAGLKHQLKLI
jgi:phytoene/squalene synthetase